MAAGEFSGKAKRRGREKEHHTHDVNGMNDEDLPNDWRNAREVLAVFQFCREEEIRGSNRDLHETCQPQEQQETTHRCLLCRRAFTLGFAQQGTALLRNCGLPPPSGILCAKSPSPRESSKSRPAVLPTRFRGPVRPPRPRRRSGFHRST